MLVLTGCGGADLSKQNFDRSTVPMEPGQARGEVPDGPIEDAAVSADKLRGIDACGVLEDSALDRLGDPGDFSAQGWAECMADVTAPEGAEIDVRLEVGADTGTLTAEPHGQLAGLPLTVNDRDGGACDVTVTTSKDPEIGITADIEYDDGQACRAGKVVLDEVVQQLHDDPATLAEEPDSVIRVDPCGVLDGADVADVLGEEQEGEHRGIYSCDWVAEDPTVSVTFREGYKSTLSDDRDKVKLGSGVKGYSGQIVEDINSCDVDWTHRELEDGTIELVTVKYENYTGDPKSDKPCDKAETVAKSMVSELPDAG